VISLEVFFRYLFLQTSFLDNHYVNNDAWWRLRWIRNRRYVEEDVANYFSIYRYDKILGWNPRSNLKNHDIGKGAFLTTNSVGIRDDKEFSKLKHEGKTRILILGDSFSFGEEVSDNQTFSYLLEQLLTESEVINMGVGGYGHDQMFLKLKTEGIKYQPDMIIVGFLESDMDRNILSFRDYSKPIFTLINNEIITANNEIPEVDEILKREAFKFKIADFFSLLSSKIRERQIKAEMEEMTKAILDFMTKTSMENKSQILFVYLPVSKEIFTDNRNMGEEFFKEYCRSTRKKYQNGFNCFDLRPVFREASNKGDKFRGGHFPGHYDVLAHALIANSIKNFLVQYNYFPYPAASTLR